MSSLARNLITIGANTSALLFARLVAHIQIRASQEVSSEKLRKGGNDERFWIAVLIESWSIEHRWVSIPFVAFLSAATQERIARSLRYRAGHFRNTVACTPPSPHTRPKGGAVLRSLRRRRLNLSEGTMTIKKHGFIIESPTEARQAEPGPSVLALLTVSTGLAVLILGGIWFAFF